MELCCWGGLEWGTGGLGQRSGAWMRRGRGGVEGVDECDVDGGAGRSSGREQLARENGGR